jgi:hypothetical protein
MRKSMNIELEKFSMMREIMNANPEQILKLKQAFSSVFEKKEESDFWEELSPKSKARIEESEKQIAKDEGIPHEAVIAKYRKQYTR